MDIGSFINQMGQSPILIVISLLVTGVIFINGWTDAPNSIATAVSTRAITPRKAVILASIFNFLGVLIMTLISGQVAFTISNMVDFGTNTHYAMTSLCAGMVAVVVYSFVAWMFGIPTSESHSLIAGLTGAALAAMTMGVEAGINMNEWGKVLWGLLLSVVVGFGLGFIIVRLIQVLFKKMQRRHASIFFKNAEVGSAAMMSFVHGAQDGQKFIGVFILALTLSNSSTGLEGGIPIWLIIFVSLIMSLGTSLGGYKIIKKVGMGMAKLEQYEGFATDISASIGILLSTFLGVPVSTTHMKATAIMGVGASKNIRRLNWGTIKEMVITWVLTFPGCGLLGFGFAYLFQWIFN